MQQLSINQTCPECGSPTKAVEWENDLLGTPMHYVGIQCQHCGEILEAAGFPIEPDEPPLDIQAWLRRFQAGLPLTKEA